MKALPVLGAALLFVACGNTETTDTTDTFGNTTAGSAATNSMDPAGTGMATGDTSGMGAAGTNAMGADSGLGTNGVAGTNGMAGTNGVQAAPGNTTASNNLAAADYIAMAGAADMWEIESSRALIAKSNNAELKRFAQMMIDHHTQATQKVKAAAQTDTVTAVAPKMDAEQQRMLNEIKNADAQAVDAIYIRHQRAAHLKALALHQGFAANSDNQALKQAATEIVPVVQEHIAALGRLSPAN